MRIGGRVLIHCAGRLRAALPSHCGTGDEQPPASVPTIDYADPPFLAIWRDDEGNAFFSKSPFLRAAFWEDGRAVFARDENPWGHDLLAGTIAPYRVARLKHALLESGVFDLAGNCYLGPDLPTDCIRVKVGEHEQTLYWWEGYMPWMDTPGRLEFARCWKAVNQLALVACPDQVNAVDATFQRPPRSWYLRKAIQSK